MLSRIYPLGHEICRTSPLQPRPITIPKRPRWLPAADHPGISSSSGTDDPKRCSQLFRFTVASVYPGITGASIRST
jgi:hypothetical protein